MNIIIIITETVGSGIGALVGFIGAILVGAGSIISWPITFIESVAGAQGGDFSGVVLIILFVLQIIIAIVLSSPGILFITCPLTMVFSVWLSDVAVGGGSSGGVVFTYYLGAIFMGICLAVIPAYIVSLITE